jgi:hypothetical protein
MADFDETYPVTDELAAHWNQLRITRGWSWEVLADYFERYCGHDPCTPGLVEWARSQSDAAPSKRKGSTRATTEAPEKR